MNKKILLKLSGESLSMKSKSISVQTVTKLVRELVAVNKEGVALAIMIGGGNIWRFRDKKDLILPRESSDYLGMLATVFNAVTLTEALKSQKVKVEVFSAVAAPSKLVKKYTPAAATRVLNSGGIAVLAGGTGRPYVTTDTGAAMRASELGVERVLKATNVDGVYDSDPRKNKQAKFFQKLNYTEVLKRKLGVMDEKAFRLLAKQGIPLTIFNFRKKGFLAKATRGEKVGTEIK